MKQKQKQVTKIEGGAEAPSVIKVLFYTMVFIFTFGLVSFILTGCAGTEDLQADSDAELDSLQSLYYPKGVYPDMSAPMPPVKWDSVYYTPLPYIAPLYTIDTMPPNFPAPGTVEYECETTTSEYVELPGAKSSLYKVINHYGFMYIGDGYYRRVLLRSDTSIVSIFSK